MGAITTYAFFCPPLGHTKLHPLQNENNLLDFRFRPEGNPCYPIESNPIECNPIQFNQVHLFSDSLVFYAGLQDSRPMAKGTQLATHPV